MNLSAQIALITVPQEFARLCNSALLAEYGNDFLPIDDDRPDRGNDGYLKSEKRLFAMHCFKRTQNQSLDNEIRSKMMSDLSKAAKLRDEGLWAIEAWTFICNYPIPESVGREILLAGKRLGIDPSWRGPEYLADVLQRVKGLRSSFPNLQVSEVMDQLETILVKLEDSNSQTVREPINWIPRDTEEQEDLIAQRPPGWEYLLFAGVLDQGRRVLEPKWQDYKSGYARRKRVRLDEKETVSYLIGMWVDAQAIMRPIDRVFSEEAQQQAFGAPGEPGNALLIEHSAKRVLTSYEELLDWAADIRGIVFPEKFRRAFELAPLVMERPALDIRDFITRTVVQLGRLPDLLAHPDSGPIAIELPLTVTIDDAAMATFSEELDRVRSML
jgi:hypothetical protein